ncbi:MAG TPA: hypothetical protein VNS63_04975 [Blastocatellia bacterium]|nr:hypothetical protein [Blastocatellia bacterium]
MTRQEAEDIVCHADSKGENPRQTTKPDSPAKIGCGVDGSSARQRQRDRKQKLEGRAVGYELEQR